MRKLTIAYSPCPNDTFMFHDVANGNLRLQDTRQEIHLHDVETLNHNAMAGVFDITKISFHTYLFVRDTYRLLHAGAALGFGCGPLVVTGQNISRADLAQCRIVVPGEFTTAHLLLRLWAPVTGEKVFVPYDRIMAMVAQGEADAGVIIHEGRFVYRDAGLKCIVDLGEWWERETGLPIPLGCIVARRTLGDDTIRKFEDILGQSIANALANPERTYAYVKAHAQEIDETVIRQHIETFVNRFSIDLGDDGLAAVAQLDDMARHAGIIK